MKITIDQQQVDELHQQRTELLQRFYGGTTGKQMKITFYDGHTIEIHGYIESSPEIANIYTNEAGHSLFWEAMEKHGDSISCRYDGNYIDLDKTLYVHVSKKWWQQWTK